MHLTPDLINEVVRDRGQQLRAEADAHRLVGSAPARRHVAHLLRRAADRLDTATSPCSHIHEAVPQRG